MISARHIKQNIQSGFTLLEVLLVVAIIAILAGIVIVAINPAKNLGDTRNSQRSSDVNAILSAASQYTLDNNALPAGITAVPTEICATSATTCTGLVDLTPLTTAGKYLSVLPKDPQCATLCAPNGIGYKISKDTSDLITVTAPFAEQGKTISVTK